MGNKKIRVGQIIAPFGPGSLYTDRHGISHVICGLDHWFKKYDHTSGKMVACEDKAEFALFEPRLSELLGVDGFFSPPDHRPVRQGVEASPNAALHIPALRFPGWYRHSSTGELCKFDMEVTVIPRLDNGGRWIPVRFVSVCKGGHLSEFPWKEWAGCTCIDDGELYINDHGGSELSSIRVNCRSCPEGSAGRQGRTLSGTTTPPVNDDDKHRNSHTAFHNAGIGCPGHRVWLGNGASEPDCADELVGALINQTNLYFPKTTSAIRLPDLRQKSEAILKLRNEIESDAVTAGIAKTYWRGDCKDAAINQVVGAFEAKNILADRQEIHDALESLFHAGFQSAGEESASSIDDSKTLAFRRKEFNVIRNEIDDETRSPHLRVIASTVPSAMKPWLEKVNLVERLCETRVFFGFDRLEPPQQDPFEAMPHSAMTTLFRKLPSTAQERWLPAIEVFGEGIYLEFNEERIARWQADNSEWLAKRLTDLFLERLAGIQQTLPPSLVNLTRKWASKYLLIHSFSHVLLNQFVFECGYSTASLRERLFISVDSGAPMAGLLIYTAAGDSEGTMGGLVRLGQPDHLDGIIRRALSRAAWCSADPICSEQMGGHGSRLANLAACHACVLLPETSCETINQGLDRSMLVGTPEALEHGFFESYLNHNSIK